MNRTLSPAPSGDDLFVVTRKHFQETDAGQVGVFELRTTSYQGAGGHRFIPEYSPS